MSGTKKDLQNSYLKPVPNKSAYKNTSNEAVKSATNGPSPVNNTGPKTADSNKIPSNFNVQLPALDTLLKAPKVKLKAVHQYADNALPPQHGFADAPKEAVGAIIEEKLVEGIIDSETAPTNIECDCDVCVAKKGGKPKNVEKKAPLPPLKILPPEKQGLPDGTPQPILKNGNGNGNGQTNTTTTTTTTTIVKAGEQNGGNGNVENCNCPECQLSRNPQTCPVCNPTYGYACPVCTQYSYHLGYAYGYPPYGYYDPHMHGGYGPGSYNQNNQSNGNALRSIEPKLQTDRSLYGRKSVKMIEAKPSHEMYPQSSSRLGQLVPTERSLYAEYDEDGRPRYHYHHKVSHLKTSDPEIDRLSSSQLVDKDHVRPLWNPSNVLDRNNPTRLDKLDTLRLKQNLNGLSPRPPHVNGIPLLPLNTGRNNVKQPIPLGYPTPKTNSLNSIKTSRVITNSNHNSAGNVKAITNGEFIGTVNDVNNQVDASNGSNGKKQTVILINPT